MPFSLLVRLHPLVSLRESCLLVWPKVHSGLLVLSWTLGLPFSLLAKVRSGLLLILWEPFSLLVSSHQGVSSMKPCLLVWLEVHSGLLLLSWTLGLPFSLLVNSYRLGSLTKPCRLVWLKVHSGLLLLSWALGLPFSLLASSPQSGSLIGP